MSLAGLVYLGLDRTDLHVSGNVVPVNVCKVQCDDVTTIVLETAALHMRFCSNTMPSERVPDMNRLHC